MTKTAIESRTPATGVTARADEDLLAGQLVALVPSRDEHPAVAPAQPGQRVFGIAGVDAEVGSLAVIQRGAGRCFLVDGPAYSAGTELVAGPDGTVTEYDEETGGVIAAVAVGTNHGNDVCEISLV